MNRINNAFESLVSQTLMILNSKKSLRVYSKKTEFKTRKSVVKIKMNPK